MNRESSNGERGMRGEQVAVLTMTCQNLSPLDESYRFSGILTPNAGISGPLAAKG